MNCRTDKPLVSIGVPVYNGGKYMRKALDSLLGQDYANFELIISDNASTDNTPDICKEYTEQDDRIVVRRQKNPVGALDNFKKVLMDASGEYFMWAAVDDYWLPGFVSVLAGELDTHSESDVAMCAVDRIDEEGRIFDTVSFYGRDNPNEKGYYSMMNAVLSPKKYNLYIYGLFRRNFLERAISSLPEVPCSDRLLICHISMATKFRYVNKTLHVRLIRNKSSDMRVDGEKIEPKGRNAIAVDAEKLLALGSIIVKSRLIPLHRKFYLPLILFRYGFNLIRGRTFKILYFLGSIIKKRMTDRGWDKLKRTVRSILRKKSR